jgi:Mor family transcriptional regulator
LEKNTEKIKRNQKIFEAKKAGATYRELTAKYGITQKTLYNIIKRYQVRELLDDNKVTEKASESRNISIYEDRLRGLTYPEISIKYGISKSAVYAVLRRFKIELLLSERGKVFRDLTLRGNRIIREENTVPDNQLKFF